MAKIGRPPQVIETPPSGAVTWASPPRPVQAQVRWTYGDGSYLTYDIAWAMAWTTTEVYVFLKTNGLDSGVLAWVRADQVRRR